MDEVDGILVYTLQHIGCEIGTKVADLTPSQLISCVTKCLQLSRPDFPVPEFDGNVSMSARYKMASQLAEAITDLGYKDEVGCQSFLYPTETESRKILIFMVENLPRDSQVGEQIEILLSKLAQDKAAAEEKEKQNEVMNGVEVDGIKLPIAVDVDSLPKETLKFYASHLSDITFSKQREKYRNKGDAKPIVPDVIKNVEESDDDFGDPDVDIPEEKPIFEKPKLPIKPKIKPVIPEKPPKIDNNNKEMEEAEAKAKQLQEEKERATTAYIKELQENSKSKAKTIKEKEKRLKEINNKTLQFQQEIDQLSAEFNQKVKTLDRLKKMDQLLSGDEDALEKVKGAVDSQVEKLMGLNAQWETHRKPLIEEIHNKRALVEKSEAAIVKEEILSLRVRLKEMGQEAKTKENYYNQLKKDIEKLPKDINRSSYTRRIHEIIGNIKKQKKEISKVLGDTKEIQKDINTLTGKLDRTFTVADELIYKFADKDKNVAMSYKLLVAIHSDYSRIIKVLEDIGNLKRQQTFLEDKLEFEKGKNVEEKLKRLKADLATMKHESQIWEAKMRDPTLKKRTNKILTNPMSHP